jgi:hypothetical protein
MTYGKIEDDTIHSTLSSATPRRGLMSFRSSERPKIPIVPARLEKLPPLPKEMRLLENAEYDGAFSNDPFGQRNTPLNFLNDAVIAINEFLAERKGSNDAFSIHELSKGLDLPESKCFSIIASLLRLQRLAPVGGYGSTKSYKIL